MTPTHYPPPGEFDPFDDPLDDLDEFDGFTLVDDLDEPESLCYRGVTDHPFCEMGIGDSEGLCVKERFGCHHIGCEFSDD